MSQKRCLRLGGWTRPLLIGGPSPPPPGGGTDWFFFKVTDRFLAADPPWGWGWDTIFQWFPPSGFHCVFCLFLFLVFDQRHRWTPPPGGVVSKSPERDRKGTPLDMSTRGAFFCAGPTTRRVSTNTPTHDV